MGARGLWRAACGHRRAVLIVVAGLAALAWLLADGRTATGLLPAPASAAADGAVLFAAAGCGNCHTDRAHHGGLLAGGRALVTPFGTFYTPNISADPEFGIGRWSEADFIRALRRGVGPGGMDYYPSFPYPAFTQMTDADLLAIRRYILTLPPQRQPNRAHALKFPYDIRAGLKLWKVLFLREGRLDTDPDQSREWNRGAYLVRAVVHCGECHTPRNRLGAEQTDRRFAGATFAVDGAKAPDITPDPGAIGRWSIDDIASYLDDGLTPSGDAAAGAMAEVIGGTSMLRPSDRHAIAVYIKSQAPIPPTASRKVSPGD